MVNALDSLLFYEHDLAKGIVGRVGGATVMTLHDEFSAFITFQHLHLLDGNLI